MKAIQAASRQDRAGGEHNVADDQGTARLVQAKPDGLAVSAGGSLDSCQEADMQLVAELHAKVFYGGTMPASKGLVDYYREVFFHNPWVRADLPSLVYRSAHGRIDGFLGVIPRYMYLKKRRILVAVAHRLMVAPENRCSLAGIHLLHQFLGGPQDLTIGDGANEIARKLWAHLGGVCSPLYSMNWFRPLRPSSFVLEALRRKGLPKVLTAVGRPLTRFVDVALGLCPHIPAAPRRVSTVEKPIDEKRLLDCLTEFSCEYLLRPDYNVHSLRWLLTWLGKNTSRGALRGFIIEGDAGRPLGACLYYLNASRIAEVLQLLVRPSAEKTVLQHLFYRAWQEGALGVSGRFEPRLMDSLWEQGCLVKRGCCALMHSRDSETLDIINRGDAFLTALEGELWLSSPLAYQ